jgi:Ca-activated chloride channel family protein
MVDGFELQGADPHGVQGGETPPSSLEDHVQGEDPMRSVILASLCALAALAPASGQGWIDPIRPVPDWGVTKLRTSVNVQVSGRVARVEVEEWFQNRGNVAMGESDYLYPLPGEAVFSNFSLFQGDQELRGETMDAERARGIYEEIVRKKRDPALIELAGHGLLRARVFPIAAGETRKITLRYTQVLSRAGDALQFRYSVGARNAQPVMRPIDRISAREQSGRRPDAAPLTFTLTVANGREFRDAFSPTHDVQTERRDGRMTVRPTRELNGDFALFLPLATSAVGITVATHRPSGESGYFMLTLSPGEVRASSAPRDITAVIDISGSMSGEKMQQARAALRRLISTLDTRDRFRLIAFSNAVRSYRPDWTAATPNELGRARAWVDGLQAEGGTNISGALDEAFRASPDPQHLSLVVFLTDGLPSVGEQNPERIADKAERERGQARVFAFGVGYDVNTYLLDRLSAAARGSTQYVQPGENVEQAVATLANKVRHPVLSDLRIGDSPARLTDIYPRTLPDLFAGEELVVFGRYDAQRGGTEAPVTITGRRAGRAERYSTRARFAEHENDNDYIPRLWASRKLAALSQQMRLEGRDPRVIEEIRELALRHGLLSEYTSYLVQEPLGTVVAGNSLRRERAVTGEAVRVTSAAPAMAPAASVGQRAVEMSAREQQSSTVRTSAELGQAQLALKGVAQQDRLDSSVRQHAGRQFRQQGALWADDAHKKTQRVQAIEAFSPAYFAILQKLPELEPYWKEFDQVLVAGKRVSIQVSKGGAQRLSAADLNRLVSEFRSR